MKLPKIRADKRTSTKPRPGLGGRMAAVPHPGRTLPTEASTDPDSQSADAGPGAAYVGRGPWLTKALSVLFVAALVCGPTALLVSFLRQEQPAQAQGESTAAAAQRRLSRQMVAQESAIQWVQAWAGASESNHAAMDALWGGALPPLPQKASAITELRAVNAQAAAPGVWSVLVSAVVTDPGKPAVRRYYQVPVVVSGEGGAVQAAPQAMPALVTGPAQPSDVTRGDYPHSIAESSPAWETTQAFLSALLAGAGDVTRYTTPGVTIAPLPATSRYAHVKVALLQGTGEGIDFEATPTDGARTQVLARVEVGNSAAPGQQQTAEYPLQLVARGGRWEVSAITPALSGGADAAGSSPTTSPTTTSSGGTS